MNLRYTTRMVGWQLRLWGLIFLFFSGFGLGCGYSFQTSHSEYLTRRGVTRVFLPPTVNESYKPGVEMVVHNALIKALVTRGVLRIVTDRELADAELITAVRSAQYTPSALSVPKELGYTVPGVTDRIPTPSPQPEGFQAMSIAQRYVGGLGVHLMLKHLKAPSVGQVIWSSGFSRTQEFAGANQLDVPGATSALINESEFDRVLAQLATQISADAHDALVAAF